MRRILTSPISMLAYLITAVCIAILLLTRTNWSPTNFVLNDAGYSVIPASYPGLHAVGNWLTGHKHLVLTFDDGPYGNGVDEHILNILRKHQAHAVFFVVCDHIDSARIHVLNEIERSGNIIGNHSYDHLHLKTLSTGDLHHQIDDCSARIAQTTGHRPAYFRPPFGQTSQIIKQVVSKAGMQQMLWDANSEDSWLTKPDQIFYWSLSQAQNNSILLMHDKPATASVLDRVLTALQQTGSRFVLPSSSAATATLR